MLVGITDQGSARRVILSKPASPPWANTSKQGRFLRFHRSVKIASDAIIPVSVQSSPSTKRGGRPNFFNGSPYDRVGSSASNRRAKRGGISAAECAALVEMNMLGGGETF